MQDRRHAQLLHTALLTLGCMIVLYRVPGDLCSYLGQEVHPIATLRLLDLQVLLQGPRAHALVGRHHMYAQGQPPTQECASQSVYVPSGHMHSQFRGLTPQGLLLFPHAVSSLSQAAQPCLQVSHVNIGWCGAMPKLTLCRSRGLLHWRCSQ